MYDVLYRRGLTPWVAAGHAQSALIERLLAREESWHGAAAGRTLVDLGCGTGEHSLAAATRGWTVVGIDASAVAIDRARRAAAASGLDVRFVAGDVRRLTDVPGLRPGVSVFVDVGCYHGRPPADRRLVADGVARLAASRASLLVVGMDRRPGLVGVGVTADGPPPASPGGSPVRPSSSAAEASCDACVSGCSAWSRAIPPGAGRRTPADPGRPSPVPDGVSSTGPGVDEPLGQRRLACR